jgi:hypothetical protein
MDNNQENMSSADTNAPADPKHLSLEVDIVRYGVSQAGKSGAAPAALETNIKHIFSGTFPGTSTDFSRVRADMLALEGQIAGLRAKKGDVDSSIARLKAEIAASRQQLSRSKEIADPSEKAGFGIMAIIWAMLLVYLFVFYVNAAYNAFFFQPANQQLEDSVQIVGTAIMNPAAMGAAFGTTAAPILLTYPFIFLGLGFLLHQFQRKRQYVLIGAIYVGTFLYDALLAYEIVHKIHMAQYALQQTTTPWSLSMAFSEMTFYLVLASGFLVYLVWGLLTSALVDLGDKLFREANHAMSEELGQMREAHDGLLQKERDLGKEIEKRESEIHQHKAQLALFERMAQGFLKGWINFICLQHSSDAPLAERLADDAKNLANQVVAGLLSPTSDSGANAGGVVA